MKASYHVELINTGEHVCYFLVDGRIDRGARGTDGTGCKIYQTKQKAKAAGERYNSRMARNGFVVEQEDKA